MCRCETRSNTTVSFVFFFPFFFLTREVGQHQFVLSRRDIADDTRLATFVDCELVILQPTRSRRSSASLAFTACNRAGPGASHDESISHNVALCIVISNHFLVPRGRQSGGLVPFGSTCEARGPPANSGDTEGRRASKDAYEETHGVPCPRRDFVASLS